MNTKLGRNEPCYCGSGKKFKKCCIDKPKPMSKELEEDLALGQQRIAEDEEERKKRSNLASFKLVMAAATLLN